jgi:hypothetical protein
MGTHLVVRTRLKHLISDKVFVARIHDAVHRANDIVHATPKAIYRCRRGCPTQHFK